MTDSDARIETYGKRFKDCTGRWRGGKSPLAYEPVSADAKGLPPS